jgi:hypothetical protein
LITAALPNPRLPESQNPERDPSHLLHIAAPMYAQPVQPPCSDVVKALQGVFPRCSDVSRPFPEMMFRCCEAGPELSRTYDLGTVYHVAG